MVPMDEQCDPTELLREKGLSRTAPRIAVLEALIGAAAPVAVNDLVAEGLKMDRATIYRTLNTLRDKRLVREIPTASGTNYYEIACRHNPFHPHFYCTCCRSMTCLAPLSMESVNRWITLPEAFSFKNLVISLTGLCERCSRPCSSRRKE